MLQVIHGDLPGVPSAHVIRFTESGQIVIEGPVAAAGPEVSRAAHLLDTLLAGRDDAAPTQRVSGALRIVVARALGAIDLPPYPSLAAFAEALTRFAASDVRAVVRELHAAWSASVQAGTIVWRDAKQDVANEDGGADADAREDALTISDIRRARRETRLTLAELSERSRIPAWLLRELEWGYFRNWPAGLYGRTQLVRYARAAGLDDGVVVRAVWPMLEAEALSRGSAAVAPEDLEPADPEQVNAAAMLVPIEREPVVALAQRPQSSRQHRLAAAAAIILLLGIALVPGAWQRWPRGEQEPPQAAAPPPAAAAAPAPEPPTPAAPPAPETPAARTVPQAAAARTFVEPPGFASVGAAVFETEPAEPGEGIVRASHATSMTLRITRVGDDGARNYHARVSPDGSRIAFDSDRDGTRGVYVADADGRNVRRVSGKEFAALPSWSPDGDAVLFARAEPDRPDVWNLWTVDLEEGKPRRLTSHESGQPWGGSWFPDGRRVAYARDTSVIVLDTESGKTREFSSPLRGRAVRGPAVSPDGRHILVQVLRDGGWLLDTSSGVMQRVLADPTADSFSWAADGRKVAYYSGRAGGWNVWVKTGSW